MTSEQKQKLLKAKVAAALQHELGRVPTHEQIEEVTLLARVLYKAVLGLHYKRVAQKRAGQLALFKEPTRSLYARWLRPYLNR